MRHRVRYPKTRELTSAELAQLALLTDEYWPGRPVGHTQIEWNSQPVIEWAPGSGPVSQSRLPLEYLARNTVPVVVVEADATAGPIYRQDRLGEAWHIIPFNEHGARGRALCGEPRQGTRLSEMLASLAPAPPASVCQECLDHVGTAGRKDTPHVRFSTSMAVPTA
jgi:hypothetical protein